MTIDKGIKIRLTWIPTNRW